jgi:hypothetical protein
MEMEDTELSVSEGKQVRKETVLFTAESAQGVTETYRNIVAMNINYYMGGVPDIWRHAHRNGANLIDKNQKYKGNSHSDGLLEWLSFKH